MGGIRYVRYYSTLDWVDKKKLKVTSGGGVKEKVIGAIYGLKPLKWHSFLNIWLQTRLQTHYV